MKKIKGFILTMSASLLSMASLAFAGSGTTTKQAVADIANNVRTVGIAIIILSAVVTAILYMASSVNPGLKGKAKEALIALIIGVIILALSSQIAVYITDILPSAANGLST